MDSFIDQSFKDESLAYFKRNYNHKKLQDLQPHPHLSYALCESKLPIESLKVLEIGCGGGENLLWLSKEKKCLCTGIEPSEETVRELSRHLPFIQFKAASADRLPFQTDDFDFVLIRGVLCWVDRHFILQALGEALRVTRRWLMISDFSPLKPFKVDYKHKSGLHTWHMDYTQTLESTKIVEVIFEQYYSILNQNGTSQRIVLKDHELESDGHEWERVKTTIFRKNLDLIPTRCEEDFKRKAS